MKPVVQMEHHATALGVARAAPLPEGLPSRNHLEGRRHDVGELVVSKQRHCEHHGVEMKPPLGPGMVRVEGTGLGQGFLAELGYFAPSEAPQIVFSRMILS